MYSGERFNSYTHLAGTLAAGGGAAVLIVLAAFTGDAWKVVSASIYGTTLVLLYLSSTLYHSVQGKAKAALQKLDHSAIYLLIAGSYTPFTLVSLRGALGWTIFGIVWGLAALGIAIDLLRRDGKRIIPVIIYVLMGWLAVVGFRPLLLSLSTAGFLWLLAGGICYTGGIAFYLLEGRLRHAHGIWHLFVLAGSACQYVAIAVYVL